MTTAETPSTGGNRNPFVVFGLAGLLAGLAAVTILKASLGPLHIGLPDGLGEPSLDNPDPELEARIAIALQLTHRQNAERLLSIWFAASAGLFGFAEGLRLRNPKGMAVGLVAGVVVGGVVGWLVGGAFHNLQNYLELGSADGLTSTLILHSAMWVSVALLSVFAIGVAARRARRSFQTALPALLGGVLGVVAFGLIAGIIFPIVRTELVRFQGTGAQLIWAFLPPVLIGLAVARATPAPLETASEPQAAAAS